MRIEHSLSWFSEVMKLNLLRVSILANAGSVEGSVGHI
jgi:hypothetical protein